MIYNRKKKFWNNNVMCLMELQFTNQMENKISLEVVVYNYALFQI
jgi:hypothetical protein